LLNRDVVRAIQRGMPNIPFEFSTDNPDAEVTDLNGLKWPNNAGVPPTLAQVISWDNTIKTDFNTSVTERDTSYSDLLNQYDAALTRLDSIIANGPTYTQVQSRDALVDMAKIQRRLLRYIKSTLT
jgi:hypothetical protein